MIDCVKCSRCCKEFYPVFTEEDVRRISSHLNLSEQVFLDRYTVTADGLIILSDVPCAFLENNICSIHEVKPEICKRFPNKDTVKLFSNICPIAKQHHD